MADPTVQELQQQLTALNKKLKEAGGLGIDLQEAFRKAGTDTKKLNEYVEKLNSQYEDLVDNADYLYETFRDITAELKNQNLLLKIGKGSFREFTNIAQDLSSYQKGYNDLTDNRFKKLKNSIEAEKKELDFVVKRLKATQKSRELEFQILSDLEKRTSKQKARLRELQKENDLLINAEETLKSGIPILEKELNLTKKISDTRKDLGGIAQAAGKTISQYGGALANFLKIEDATQAVEDFNKKVIQDALNSGRVKNKLLEIERKKRLAETGRDEKGRFITQEAAQERLNELEKESYKVKQTAVILANNLGNKFKSLGVFVKELGVGFKKSLTDPVILLTFFIGKAFQANKQTVELGKSLGYGIGRADAFREKLVSIEASSRNLNVNTANLTEAFGELSKATGFAYEFTADQLTTQIKLTKQIGLTADEAAQVQRFAVLNNKTSEETYKSFLKGITAARNQLRVGIDFKATLAEAVKVSGQLAANLGNNPEIIGKAIVTAKALGMTLDQVAKSGESLLNFESSIESELKAELLTGKQLNLERARAAALAGDQITLAEELAKNIGSSADFTKMNVLQQKALAESVGMTADELANTLRKREEAIKSGKSLAQINAEEVAQALERQSIQDKFNAAIEKLQSLFGNLMAGPLGSFIDLLSGALNIINYMATPLKIVAGIFGTIFGISKAIAATEGLTAAIAGRKVGFAAAELGYKTASNVLSIKDNALAAISLATEGSKLSFKQLGIALEGESFAIKTVAYSLALKDLIVERTKALLSKLGLLSITSQIAKYPALLVAKGTEAAISTETAAATTVTAEAVTGGAATLWIVGGLAAVMGALATYYAMKDGEIDPTKGPVISGGFGSVQLDPNDKAMYGADGKIKVGTDLFGKEGATKINDKNTILNSTGLGGGKNRSTPQIDFTPMIAYLEKSTSRQIAALDKISSRPATAYINGEDAFAKKVVTTSVQNSYKVA